MLRLECAVQKYAWGKVGMKSTVAQLKKGGDNEFIIRDDDHYAELWMGTHPSGPSKTVESDGTRTLLKDYLADHLEAQGTVAVCPSGDLPFMFKVLSISKALSIQAHPDKALAARLHASNPKEYRDTNHKPEMAISLTDFEAMCGFRALEEIVTHLSTFPELRALISDDAVALLTPVPRSENERRSALKAVFTSFVTAPEAMADTQVSKLVSRLNSTTGRTPLENVLLRLANQYPGDRGMMGPLLLNYVTLGPGHAFVMYANEPHAYLQGDILECMACSDNVVRVGLTPKFRDVNTLVNMLTYSSGPMTSTLGVAVNGKENHRLFTPKGIDEFEVETLRLGSGDEFNLPSVNSVAVILILSGTGVADDGEKQQAMQKGSVFVLPANTRLHIEAGPEGLYLASAHANLSL